LSSLGREEKNRWSVLATARLRRTAGSRGGSAGLSRKARLWAVLLNDEFRAHLRSLDESMRSLGGGGTTTLEYRRFVVDTKPYCFWDPDLATQDLGFIESIQPEYFATAETRIAGSQVR
jgi:hypothetical protein